MRQIDCRLVNIGGLVRQHFCGCRWGGTCWCGGRSDCLRCSRLRGDDFVNRCVGDGILRGIMQRVVVLVVERFINYFLIGCVFLRGIAQCAGGFRWCRVRLRGGNRSGHAFQSPAATIFGKRFTRQNNRNNLFGFTVARVFLFGCGLDGRPRGGTGLRRATLGGNGAIARVFRLREATSSTAASTGAPPSTVATVWTLVATSILAPVTARCRDGPFLNCGRSGCLGLVYFR